MPAALVTGVLDEVVLQPRAVKRLIEPSEVADVIAGVPVTMDLGWSAK
jgi:3-hydroxybutyrate dehydrogenase